MDWNNKLTIFEENADWKSSIQLLNETDENNPEIYLRVMFQLVDFLVDGEYSPDEHDLASSNLKEIYDNSCLKFSDNTEFLFFAGIMGYIAEIYFTMGKLAPAAAMLEKAMHKEPNNLLYKWGYYSIIDQRAEVNTDVKLKLSELLLFTEEPILDRLKSKGLLGRYVLGVLQSTYLKTKAIRAF